MANKKISELSDYTGTSGAFTESEALPIAYGGATYKTYTSSYLRRRTNWLDNTAFQIWQRGTSVAGAASGSYTADRWAAIRGGSATGYTVSQGVDLTGPVPYFAKVQRDSGNASAETLAFGQALTVPDSTFLVGKTVALSFYAKCGANFSSTNSVLSVALNETGESTEYTMFTAMPLGNWLNGTDLLSEEQFTLTTSWQRFVTTAIVLADSRQLGIQFAYTPDGTAGADDWFAITGVQLEHASVATPYYPPNAEDELNKCQQFFEVLGKVVNTPIGTGFAYTTNNAQVAIQYKKKRATPAITVSGSFTLLRASGSPNAVSAIGVIQEMSLSAARHVSIEGTGSLLVAGDGTFLLPTDINSYYYVSSEI